MPQPFSLTTDELGELPVTVGTSHTRVLAWVRYPAIAVRVTGVVVAWTQRAVYIQWEDRGTHRAWVWASAIERAGIERDTAERAPEAEAVAVAAAATPAAPTYPEATAVTVLSTESLVKLVNEELALIGAELVSALAKPTGSVVFGIIDGRHVQLHFLTEPATDMCSVLLVSKDAEVLPDRSLAATFEEAIRGYAWAEAVDALELA